MKSEHPSQSFLLLHVVSNPDSSDYIKLLSLLIKYHERQREGGLKNVTGLPI